MRDPNLPKRGGRALRTGVHLSYLAAQSSQVRLRLVCWSTLAGREASLQLSGLSACRHVGFVLRNLGGQGIALVAQIPISLSDLLCALRERNPFKPYFRGTES